MNTITSGEVDVRIPKLVRLITSPLHTPITWASADYQISSLP